MIPAIRSVINEHHKRDSERNLVHILSAIKDVPGVLPETSKFGELIAKNLRTKVMDRLMLVHYQATTLCPATKVNMIKEIKQLKI